MTTIASLGIQVSTQGVQQATQQLGGLANAGTTAQQAAAGAAQSMQQAGISAGQLANATRNLPAQFTDIITALQGGQAPLTVLLQQGGQIQDMFGGIGPALQAVGNQITAVLTSTVGQVAIAAGAVLAFAVAWKQGADEAVAFNQALALTGNIAGTTADQMQAMAIAMDQVGGTQHEAALALAEVAKTGRFTADQLQDVASAAVAMNLATGQAIEETVKQFAKMADDPVKAVVELNEQYHLLTLEQYEHIKALQEQGREEEALTQAIRDASKGLNQRAKDVAENVGFMAKHWRILKGIVLETWDAMRDAGRASSAISDAQMQIAIANSSLNAIAHRTRVGLANGRQFTAENVASIHRDIERLVREKRRAEAIIANDPATRDAQRKAATQRANEAAIALDQEAESYASQVEKLGAKKVAALGKADAAIRLAQQQGNTALVAAIKADAKTISDAIDKEIAEINERDKKKGRKPRKPKAAPADQGLSILARIRQQIALNGEELASQEALTTSERLRISVIEQLKDARLKTNAATRASIDAALKELEASDKTLQAHKDEEKALESLRRLTNELTTAEQNRRRQNEAQLLGIGRGRMEQEQALRRLDIERDYQDEVKRLNDLAAQEKRKVSQAELDTLREFHDRALVEEEEFQRRRAEMAADWSNGARAATADFLEDAKDMASQTYDIVRNFYDGLADVITDFLTKGKADWKGFFDDIARQITSMIVKAQLAKLVEKFMPGLGQKDQAAALSQSAGELAASAAPLMAAAAALTSAAAALAAAGTANAASGAAGGSTGGGASAGGGGGFSWAGLIQGLFSAYAGGRANGGPVSRGKLYEVGEGGKPEILTMHGRNWLIPGAGGHVTPMSAANDDGGARTVNQAFYVQGAPDSRTREQMARSSGREAARGMSRTGR